MIQVNLSNLRPRLWDRDYPIQSKLKKIMKLNPNKSNVEEKNWKNNLIKKKEPKKKQITKKKIKIDIKEYWQSMAWNQGKERKERKEKWVVGDVTQPLIHHTPSSLVAFVMIQEK
jgi:hypothetical protein